MKAYPTTTPSDLLSLEALTIGYEMPWKAANTLRRLLVLPIARLYFAVSGVHWGKKWRVYGVPIIQRHRSSHILIGNFLDLRSTVRSNPLGPNHPVVISTRCHGATITIGDSFSMSGGSIVAEESITIGNHVTVGANCVIIDTDFHPLDSIVRRDAPLGGATAPVEICDNVFIGLQSIVLKGVTIGANTVIGAGSVVTRDIPANTVAAGSPARPIRLI